MKFIRHRNSKMTLKTEHELKPFLNFIDDDLANSSDTEAPFLDLNL